jgi:hypothetical protein
MRSDLGVFNDADVIDAQTRANVSSSPLLQQQIAGGAITNIAGAQGQSITITGSGASGWTISASGAANQLTFSVAVTNAATARTGLGIDAVATKKSNLSAAVAPTVADDSSAGYAVGSFWIDTVLQDGYWLMDASVGAAVWKKITP